MADFNRILESSTSTGTGDIVLAGAITGFRRFNAACAVGDTVRYFIEAIDSTGQPTGDMEYGIGTYSAANTITRTLVMGSSNGGALVNFAAGNKNVGVAALGDSMVPTGSKHEFPCTTAPDGYVIPQGQTLSRAAYPALWKFAQGSGNIAADDASWVAGGLTTCGQFSPGDGATTFRLPDWRGMHSRAADLARGVDAGRGVGSYEADSVKDHTHPTGYGVVTTGGYGTNNGGTFASGAAPGTITGGASGATAENRVKTIAFLWCMKT